MTPTPHATLFLTTALLFALGNVKAFGQSRTTDSAADHASVNVGRNGQIDNLDPSQPYDLLNLEITRQICDTLVHFKPDSTDLELGLAESWSISPDMLAYRFKIRPGLTFHDGTPVNADAVVFSLKRQFDKSHEAYGLHKSYGYFNDMGFDKLIRDVKAIDSLTVEFVLTRPEAPFLASLAMPFAAVISPEAMRRTKQAFGDNPICSGPFQIAKRDKDKRVELIPFPGYWGPKPHLTRLNYSAYADDKAINVAFLKRQIDITATIDGDQAATLLKGRPDARAHPFSPSSVFFMAINTQRSPWNKTEVRQAINLVLDRAMITRAGLRDFGTPAVNPLPPGTLGYNSFVTSPARDLAKAKALLKQSGVVLPLKAVLPLSASSNTYGRMAEEIKKELAPLGIDVKVEKLPKGLSDRLNTADFDFTLSSWYSDNGDPDNFLAVMFESKNANNTSTMNLSQFSNSAVDDLLHKAKSTPLPEVRAEFYKQVQIILSKELPVIPLAHTRATYVIGGRVATLPINPLYFASYNLLQFKDTKPVVP